MGQSQSNEQTFSPKKDNNEKSRMAKKQQQISSLNETTNKINNISTPPPTPILIGNYSSKVDSTKLTNQLEKQITNIKQDYSKPSNIEKDASNIIKSVYKSYLVRRDLKTKKEACDIIKSVYKSHLVREELKTKLEASNIIKSIYKSHLVREELKTTHGASNKIKTVYKSYLVRKELKNKQNASNVIKSYIRDTNKRKNASIIKACIKGFSDRLYVNELEYFNQLEEDNNASIIQGLIKGHIMRVDITKKLLLINSIDIWKRRVYGNILHKESKGKLFYKLNNLKYGLNNWYYYMNEMRFIYNYLDRYYNFKLLKKYFKLWVKQYREDYYNRIYTSLQIQTNYKKLVNEYKNLPKTNMVNSIKYWKINTIQYNILNKFTKKNVDIKSIINRWNRNTINETLKMEYFDNWYYYTGIYKLHLADIHRNLLFKKKSLQIWNNNSRYQKMKRRQYGLSIQKAYIQYIYNSLFNAFNVWKLKNHLFFSYLK